VVGAARFELTTSCSQSRRSTRLSYAPNGAATLIETYSHGKIIFGVSRKKVDNACDSNKNHHFLIIFPMNIFS
jgi:hypothetical protein